MVFFSIEDVAACRLLTMLTMDEVLGTLRDDVRDAASSISPIRLGHHAARS
jgi:hypothetical protein